MNLSGLSTVLSYREVLAALLNVYVLKPFFGANFGTKVWFNIRQLNWLK